MATYLNIPRAYSVTIDKYGIDALRDRALPLILAIPTYKNFEIKQHYRGRPDLIANDTYGNVNLWWVIMAYNGICSFREIVEGNGLKIPTSTLVSRILSDVASRQSSKTVRIVTI